MNHWLLVWLDIWNVVKYILPCGLWIVVGTIKVDPDNPTPAMIVGLLAIFVTYWSCQ